MTRSCLTAAEKPFDSHSYSLLTARVCIGRDVGCVLFSSPLTPALWPTLLTVFTWVTAQRPIGSSRLVTSRRVCFQTDTIDEALFISLLNEYRFMSDINIWKLELFKNAWLRTVPIGLHAERSFMTAAALLLLRGHSREAALIRPCRRPRNMTQHYGAFGKQGANISCPKKLFLCIFYRECDREADLLSSVWILSFLRVCVQNWAPMGFYVLCLSYMYTLAHLTLSCRKIFSGKCY